MINNEKPSHIVPSSKQLLESNMPSLFTLTLSPPKRSTKQVSFDQSDPVSQETFAKNAVEPDSIDFSDHNDKIASWSYIAREVVLQPKKRRYQNFVNQVKEFNIQQKSQEVLEYQSMLQRVDTYKQRQIKNQLYLQKIKSDFTNAQTQNTTTSNTQVSPSIDKFNPRKSIVMKRNKSQSLQIQTLGSLYKFNRNIELAKDDLMMIEQKYQQSQIQYDNIREQIKLNYRGTGSAKKLKRNLSKSNNQESQVNDLQEIDQTGKETQNPTLITSRSQPRYQGRNRSLKSFNLSAFLEQRKQDLLLKHQEDQQLTSFDQSTFLAPCNVSIELKSSTHRDSTQSKKLSPYYSKLRLPVNTNSRSGQMTQRKLPSSDKAVKISALIDLYNQKDSSRQSLKVHNSNQLKADSKPESKVQSLLPSPSQSKMSKTISSALANAHHSHYTPQPQMIGVQMMDSQKTIVPKTGPSQRLTVDGEVTEYNVEEIIVESIDCSSRSSGIKQQHNNQTFHMIEKLSDREVDLSNENLLFYVDKTHPQCEAVSLTINNNPQGRQPVYQLNQDEQAQLQKVLKNTNREASEPAARTNYPLIHIEREQGNQDTLTEKSEQEEDDEEGETDLMQQIKVVQSRGESLKRRDRLGYYKKMTPAFTNEKRRKLYQKDPKKGFTYVNWDIEEELHRFQKEIEQRFKVSMVNKQFKFPRLPIEEDEDQQPKTQRKQLRSNNQQTKSQARQKEQDPKAKKTAQELSELLKNYGYSNTVTIPHLSEQKTNKSKLDLLTTRTPNANSSSNQKSSHFHSQLIKNQKSQTVIEKKQTPQTHKVTKKTLDIQSTQTVSDFNKQKVDSQVSLEVAAMNARKVIQSQRDKGITKTATSRNTTNKVNVYSKTNIDKSQQVIKQQAKLAAINFKILSSNGLSKSSKKETTVVTTEVSPQRKHQAFELPLFVTKTMHDRDSTTHRSQALVQSAREEIKSFTLPTQNGFHTQQTEEMHFEETETPSTFDQVYGTNAIRKQQNMNAFFQSYCNKVPPGIKSRNMQISKTQSSSYSILGTGGGVSAHNLEQQRLGNDKIQSQASIELTNEYSNMLVKNAKTAYQGPQKKISHFNQQSVQRVTSYQRVVAQSRSRSKKEQRNQSAQKKPSEIHQVRNSSPTKTNLTEIAKSCERSYHNRNSTLTGSSLPNCEILISSNQKSIEKPTNKIIQVHSSKSLNKLTKNHVSMSSKKLNFMTYDTNTSPLFHQSNVSSMNGKEFKCSIIEEYVGGTSNSSSMLNIKEAHTAQSRNNNGWLHPQSQRQEYQSHNVQFKRQQSPQLGKSQKKTKESNQTFNMSPMEYSDPSMALSSRNQGDLNLRKGIIDKAIHRTTGNTSNQTSSNISQIMSKPTHKSGQQSLTNVNGLKLSVTKHRRNHTKAGGIGTSVMNQMAVKSHMEQLQISTAYKKNLQALGGATSMQKLQPEGHKTHKIK